ncbi:MAG TPA: hypothetical protein VER11_25640 [Polyangiaceae bacterium]|nr:hypothetical protein [Polyangiaceae bacterium]
MADLVACLQHGTIELLRPGQETRRLESPFLERPPAAGEKQKPRIVSVTRGRTSGELCYAISSRTSCEVFAQILGSSKERRLFSDAGTRLRDLDFSPADEALACTLAAADGTSAIGVFSDDGKGLHTVTEGDVIDCAPRWAPGGRREIVYASAGIGRTKAGKAVGRSPFALHRLRFSDSSVEVLISDAHYDYPAVVPVTPDVLYALRRGYEGAPPASPIARVSRVFRELWPDDPRSKPAVLATHELVRITASGSQLVADGVLAFDVTSEEELVFSKEAGVFRIAPGERTPEQLSTLPGVEQLVIHW